MLFKKAQEDIIQTVITIIALVFITLLLYGVLNGQNSSKQEQSREFIEDIEAEYFLLNLLKTKVTVKGQTMPIAEFIPLSIDNPELFNNLINEVKKLTDESDFYLSSHISYGERRLTLFTFSGSWESRKIFEFHIPSLKGDKIKIFFAKHKLEKGFIRHGGQG